VAAWALLTLVLNSIGCLEPGKSRLAEFSPRFFLAKTATMNSNEINIGELIFQRLKEEGLSVAWLARKVGKDQSNLRKALKKNSMNTELLRRIAKALKCSFSRYYEAHDE
jgi:lambda repressor-like predicted transcriptional regulator